MFKMGNPGGFKMAPAPVAKATVTHTEEGTLDITTLPGETVSLRPNPANGELTEAVVIGPEGAEESLQIPALGETVASSSEAEVAGPVAKP